MRGLALIAMLAAVVPLVQCVRQNPDVCQSMDMACYPGFHCEQGRCQPDECSSDAACPADRPQCSGGKCGPCTANDACQARAGTPYCATSGGKTGTCVACNPPAGSGMAAEGCAAEQICDGTAYQCRGCV